MRVFIIGGAGYIGSHVARQFLDDGHAVAVFDNLSSGSKANLFADSAAFIEGDILNYEFLKKKLSGYDAIVHLAAFKGAGESMVKPEMYSLNNISGTINILNAACECGVKYIIFSSSAAVYGEPQYLPVDEAHPKAPVNFYGYSKLAIENLLEWYDRLKGIRYAALRYFNAAGYDIKCRINTPEKNPANLLPIVMETAAGLRSEMSLFGNDYDTPDGTCIRDYIHVSDLAAGHAAALNYISAHNKSIACNLGSQAGTSVQEMLDAARRITGKKINVKIAPRRPGDPAVLTASSSLAHEKLHWRAQYSDIDTLIKTTWNVYHY
jgi:UDP-glucose 4-epimerase